MKLPSGSRSTARVMTSVLFVVRLDLIWNTRWTLREAMTEEGKDVRKRLRVKNDRRVGEKRSSIVKAILIEDAIHRSAVFEVALLRSSFVNDLM